MTTRISDRVSPLLGWLRGVVSGTILHLRVDAPPAPASRQVGNGGRIFWSKSSARFLAACQQQIAAQIRQPPLGGRLAVVFEAAIGKPKTTKLAEPRGDVDNFAKHPLDAATKASVWGDDGQIVALAAVKRWALPGEDPHVNMWIGVVA